jgi:hypothetical protein
MSQQIGVFLLQDRSGFHGGKRNAMSATAIGYAVTAPVSFAKLLPGEGVLFVFFFLPAFISSVWPGQEVISLSKRHRDEVGMAVTTGSSTTHSPASTGIRSSISENLSRP